MARAAKRAVDVTGESERRADIKRKAERKAARREARLGRTFESLSQKDRNVLLKELAIQAGLIDDSEDE